MSQQPITTTTGGSEGYPTDQLAYNLWPYKGLSSNRKYLSCDKEGKRVDLWTSDDKSGRQQWVFYALKDAKNCYNIKPWDGVFSNRQFFSVDKEGKTVDLWSSDDGSGRQKWVFYKIFDTPGGLPVFNVKPLKGVSSNRQFLSCPANGEKVDLWTSDDKSGRQQWVLSPLDMELVSVTFDVDTGKILGTTPEEIATQRLENETPKEQSMKFTVSKSVSNSSTFTYTGGFSIKVETEGKIGLPLVAEGKITTSVETTHTFTTSETTQYTTTYEYEFPVAVPGNSTYKATAVVTRGTMDVPYTATFKSKVTGQTVTQTGMWNGTSTGDISYTITPL